MYFNDDFKSLCEVLNLFNVVRVASAGKTDAVMSPLHASNRMGMRWTSWGPPSSSLVKSNATSDFAPSLSIYGAIHGCDLFVLGFLFTQTPTRIVLRLRAVSCLFGSTSTTYYIVECMAAEQPALVRNVSFCEFRVSGLVGARG